MPSSASSPGSSCQPAPLPRPAGSAIGCAWASACASKKPAIWSAWWDGQPYARILLDAPCSASGVLRRQPDVRLHRRASDLPALLERQRALLDALWPLLAPGGTLLYATCSILRAENADQIAGFLDAHADAQAQPIALPAGRRDGAGWQLLPGDGALDGMFYARIGKRGSS